MPCGNSERMIITDGRIPAFEVVTLRRRLGSFLFFDNKSHDE